MCRIVSIALVLAALSVFSANGLPVHPAKAHKSVSIAPGKSHIKSQRLTGHKLGQGKGATTRSRSKAGAVAQGHRSRQSARGSLSATLNGRADCGGPGPRARSGRNRFRTGSRSRSAACNTTPVQRASFFMPAPLRGSRMSLERQNTRTEADNLERIEDDDDLADRIARGMLVPVPVSSRLTINESLPGLRRYCRPWTASFLNDLARAHAAAFHRSLYVSSAVRTVEYQRKLMQINGNAAAAEGDIASPHLTGATIDIAKDGLTRQELGWLRGWLLPLQIVGKIDVEEEFQQACFHITVYKSYVPEKPLITVRQTMTGTRRAGQSMTEARQPGASGQIATQDQ